MLRLFIEFKEATSIVNICRLRFGPGQAFPPVAYGDVRVLIAKFQANQKGRKK